MNKLVYANHKWCLTIDGHEVPLSKIISGSLKMAYDELPVLSIVVDEISVDDVIIDEQKEVK